MDLTHHTGSTDEINVLLQCVAVCSNVLQRAAVCCDVEERVYAEHREQRLQC